MGTLARLLARRGQAQDANLAATELPPKKERAAQDLLHASGYTTEELRITWLAVSWMLSYPDANVVARLSELEELVKERQVPCRQPLLSCLAALRACDPLTIQEEYVDTFDTRRRGCLHLTYFSHGDTRRRGMALLRIKQEFRAAGLQTGAEELPDFLPLVLEFAAGYDPERGAKILRSNRPGVELLRLHLADIGSLWHGALVALCDTLPPLDADDRAAVLHLAEEGPDDELVGLDGYGIDGDASDLSYQTAAAGCGTQSAAPGPVPLDLLRGRPS